MIEFNHVNKIINNKTIINDFSIKIKTNELFILIGPSGSGKTTLLKMINQLNKPSSGEILINNNNLQKININQLRHSIGYVLQSSALFPNMNVFENSAIQLINLKWNKKKQQERIEELLNLVGLDPSKFISKMPNELSGGEAQRIGIVRALASNPSIVLMDEPFSALDPISKNQLQNLVLKLHHKLDTTFVFVTHDMNEAVKLGDRIAVIKEGNIQQIGTPKEIMADPNNNFVKNFISDNVKHIDYMNQVVKEKYGTDIKPNKTIETIDKYQTINDWAKKISKNPNIIIKVENRYLTSNDLINYLANK